MPLLPSEAMEAYDTEDAEALGNPNQDGRHQPQKTPEEFCTKVMLHSASDAMDRYELPKRNQRRRTDTLMNHQPRDRGAAYRSG